MTPDLAWTTVMVILIADIAAIGHLQLFPYATHREKGHWTAVIATMPILGAAAWLVAATFAQCSAMEQVNDLCGEPAEKS